MKEDNFLRDFMTLCEDTEIPPEFALWCGVFGVSAALGRRVWVDRGVFQVYPNLYVILVAGSGRMRKSTSINQIEKFLSMLDPPPNLIAQKITAEALIEALRSDFGEENKLRTTHEGYVIVDELATFLNKNSYDAGLGSLLIPLFDCKESFAYQTRGRGEEKITQACLGLLGASTIDWLKRAIPEDAIAGGLASRMIFVYSEEVPPPIPRPKFSEGKKALFEKLLRQLGRITTISGEYKFTPQADQWFDREYEAFYYSPFFDVPELRGYASRRFIHLTKLAMAFSAAEGLERVIDVPHLAGAGDVLTNCENKMESVLSQVAATDIGQSIGSIEGYIKASGGATKSEIVNRFKNKMDLMEIDNVLATLRASGQLSEEAHGSSIKFKWRTGKKLKAPPKGA